MKKYIGIGLTATSLLAGAAFADEVLQATHAANLEVVPGGYDVVVQNTAGKRVRGKYRYNYVYADDVYLFANAHNRDRFILNPSRYLEITER